MAIPNVVGNIAGNAQAQRFATANFNREQDAAKANYARQLRDNILTGLLNTGVQTAVEFGGKVYDEAHSGARQQQTIDNAKTVDDFNVRAKKLDMGINMPGYVAPPAYEPPAPTPDIAAGLTPRDDMPAPKAPPVPKPLTPGAIDPARVLAAAKPETFGTDRALAAIPNAEDRTFQARLEERKREAVAASMAAAEAARQKRDDALAKEAEANRLKSYQLIGGLQTATEQKLGARGRPVNIPQFGVQPTIDPETGIVRPKFMEQPRVQIPATGGGAAKPAFTGALAEPVVIIAAREGRKGDPTTGTPTKTWASRGAWATKAIQEPAKYALEQGEAGQVAAALRIIKANEADPSKATVVAEAIKTLDGARDASIKRMGPVFAEAGDVMGTSPADTEKAQTQADRQATQDQRQQQAATQQAADRQAAIDAQLQDVRSKAADLERDYSRDVDSALEKTFKRRGSRGGLSTQQLRDAADGDAPPDGLDAEAAAAWSQAAQATQAARVYRAKMIESLKAKAAAISGRKQGTPGGQ